MGGGSKPESTQGRCVGLEGQASASLLNKTVTKHTLEKTPSVELGLGSLQKDLFQGLFK